MAVNPSSLGPPTPAALQSLSPEHLLSLDAREARQLFHSGTLTIPSLLSQILAQIKKENANGLKLGAIVFLAPEHQLLERAEELEQELRSGRSRGPLHGIPVVLKDCIATAPGLGMPTSAGSFALLNATKITRNAPIVERLIHAGVIIIGKSNLSEFCAFKGDGLIDGFSPVGGQTKSPYVYGDIVLDEGDLSPTSPGGSSTGSAVSVSAGFALIGIGTENDGSIVQPASRQSLYALKPTLGLVTAEGCWRVSKSLDTPGCMAKSVRDLASATEAILNPEARKKVPAEGYQSSYQTSFDGLRLGFVDPTLWRFPPDLWVPSSEAKEQHDTIYHSSRDKMQALGATVVYPVNLPQPSELDLEGHHTPYIVNSYEHEETANGFFREYAERRSEVQSLASVVEYNEKHAEKCMPKDAPDQSWLVKAVKDRPSEEQYRDSFQHMRNIGKDEGLRKTLDEHSLDIVIAPMDSPVCSLSTASGYPIANVLLGRYGLKGELSRPFGLAALARPGAEGTLFRFMSAYEANFPARVIPEQLIGASET